LRTAEVMVIAAALATATVSSALATGSCCSGAAACALTEKSPDNTLTAPEIPAGWKLLFDGWTLDAHWACTAPDSNGWCMDNGAVMYNVQGGGYL